MKYITFSLPGDRTPRLGVLRADRAVDLKKLADKSGYGAVPDSLLAMIQEGPDTWRRLAALIDATPVPASDDTSHGLDQITWHAPIPRPSKNVFCLGRNYASHIKEAAQAFQRPAKMPDAPIFFTKPATSVSGPDDPIPWDRRVTQQVDYEVELGVVIGTTGKTIARGAALDHVFGYTIINDMSARDLQTRHMQWFKGKSLDGFCPMGPCIVTADEFGDPQAKRISLRVNGDMRQDATTGDMIFPVDVIIESLSLGMTIEAGDLIATGTPEGVGLGRNPPQYLEDGDVVEAEIEGIGVLRNKVVAV